MRTQIHIYVDIKMNVCMFMLAFIYLEVWRYEQIVGPGDCLDNGKEYVLAR